MAKKTDWTSIQIEYEQGAKPEELGKKYGMTAKQISDKAYRNHWIKPCEINAKAIEKSRKNYNNKIDRLIDKAFVVTEGILDNPDAKDSDKLTAVKCVIDISGLKKEKQEVTNTTPQIVVANAEDLQTLEKLKNVDFNKGIS